MAATQAAANSLAVVSGETSLWEVELVPQGSGLLYGYGSQDRPTSYLLGYYPTGLITNFGGAYLDSRYGSHIHVKAYGRSSDYASAQALANNPGYRTDSIRKLAGY